MAERNQVKSVSRPKQVLVNGKTPGSSTQTRQLHFSDSAPLLPTSPKDQIPCVTRNCTARRCRNPAPAMPRWGGVFSLAASRARRCFASTHDSPSISTTRPTHRNIHIHRQVLRHGLLQSELLCRNGTTPTPAWTKPSQSIPTLQVNCTHRHALRSPSIDTMRFFLDLHADGLFHSHSLLCFPSHKQEQS